MSVRFRSVGGSTIDGNIEPVDPGAQAPSSSHTQAVRPLDDAGNPIVHSHGDGRSHRGGLIAGGIVAVVAVLAIGGVVVWNNLIGSAYGAAEAVPADADMVVTIDFLQIRDTEQVERFVQVFAEPLAEHGIIDEAPDFEGALREFDDEAEKELGFRFAEDVFSWIGRSGSVAVWLPDSMFDVTTYDPDIIPSFLATLQVRDEQAAQSFLDRVLAEAQADGEEFERIQVGGSAAYRIPDSSGDIYLALYDGRFLVAESVTTLRRAIETDAAASVAQTEDFQSLTAALGGEPLMTMYVSSSIGEQLADTYEELGIDFPYSNALAGTSAMATFDLDDDGVALRTASAALPDFPVGAGEWGRTLPANTYGFVDVALPENYLEDMTTLYEDTIAQSGVPQAEIDALTSSADEAIGMSLIDDLLPQFGREMIFAVAPASDGALATELGLDLGLLFGIGVEDAAVVNTALDNVLGEMAAQGLEVTNRDGVRIVTGDGSEFAALTVTDDALAASSSADLLSIFVDGSGTLAGAETYQRIDAAVAGDGLVFYVDIAGIVDDFATDEAVRDVMAPLVGAGAAYTVAGDLQISEFRLLVDY